MPNLGRILPMVDKDHPPSERHGAASSEHRAESVWQRQLDGTQAADQTNELALDWNEILGPNKTELHPYTSAARLLNGKLSYVAENRLL